MKSLKRIGVFFLVIVVFAGIISNVFIANAEETVFCSECGNRIAAASHYCMYCGNNVSYDQVEKTIYCSACGEKIAPTCKFCMYCGHKMVYVKSDENNEKNRSFSANTNEGQIVDEIELLSPKALLSEFDRKSGARKLQCGSRNMEHTETQALMAFSIYLYDLTNGKYSLEIIPDDAYWNSSNTINLCKNGKLDIAVVRNSIIMKECPDAELLGIPYVFTSLDQMLTVLKDKDFRDVLFESLAGSGISVLGVYSRGTTNVFSRSSSVLTQRNLKGQKIQTMSTEEYDIDAIEAMGGTALPMALSQVNSELREKRIDGGEAPIASYVSSDWHEYAKYYCYTKHNFLPDEIILSESVLKSMSEEDMQSLYEAAEKSMFYFCKLMQETDEENENKALSEGVIFVDFDIKAIQKNMESIIKSIVAQSPNMQRAYDMIRVKQ